MDTKLNMYGRLVMIVLLIVIIVLLFLLLIKEPPQATSQTIAQESSSKISADCSEALNQAENVLSLEIVDYNAVDMQPDFETAHATQYQAGLLAKIALQQKALLNVIVKCQ